MSGGTADSAQIHNAASAGVAGAGSMLPFLDRIQTSFGSHDVSNIKAHTGSAATDANTAMGANAYATGNDVAFGETPDLHTAAHEAAHVVQQRSGVQLQDGVGQAGDRYEHHADAVADKVVQGQSAENLLSEMTGDDGGGAGGVQRKDVQFIGTPLDQELPSDAERPDHGEISGEQRRYSPEQYIEMWEEEQGRAMTSEEKDTIDRGCIGLTAMNLNGGGNPPLDNAYGSFETAHQVMTQKNATLDWLASWPLIGGLLAGDARYIVFAKLFWSNQDPDPQKRKNPDPDAFQPDPNTDEVDMSGYDYLAQPGYVNFDYGWWDEASQSFWHANHKDYGDPNDPMIVLQSTKEKFAKGYRDFDRVIYCVALAQNYDPGLAAISSAR